MIIEILSNKLNDSGIESSSRQNVDPDVIANVNKKRTVVIPDKLKSDIAALERYVDSSCFQRGMCITVSLWELLELCPRERRRADAYTTLIRFLREEMGITLNIKTNKTKNL